jgi:hypothetical protein
LFRKISFILFISFYSGVSYAQLGGTKSYDFLTLPVSARATALGGSALATNDGDLNVAIENPALLTDTMNNKVSLSYVNFFSDVNYGYFAYAKNIKKNNNISFGLHYLDYGKFARTDEIGNEIGTFSANDLSFNVSYSRSIIDSMFTLGATIKTIYSNYDTYTSVGSAFDMAALYTSPKKSVNATLLLRNIGRQWKPYVVGNREKLPFEIQAAVSKRLAHAPFRFSLTYNNMQKWDLTGGVLAIDTTSKFQKKTYKLREFGDNTMRHLVLGTEFIITENFFLRTGFNYQRRKELKIDAKRGLVGFSFGFGFRIRNFQLSYGRASYHIAGASNNFSVSVDLNSFYKKNKTK